MKFLTSHCSIVCSHCSIVCLIAKNELKMIEFSSYLKLNEIHTVDSPFNQDPKNIIFSREALISGEGRSENLKEMGNNRNISVVQIGGGQFRKRISAPTPWYQNPCDATIFPHTRPNFRKK